MILATLGKNFILVLTAFFAVIFQVQLAQARIAKSASIQSPPAHLSARLSAKTAVPNFVSLDSINYDEVCGLDQSGLTACHKGSEPSTWVPDTVGKLRTTYQNELVGCGQDEDGWKCWQMNRGWLLGTTEKMVRDLFMNSTPESLKLSYMTVCGVDQKTNELVCLTPTWESTARFWRIKPKVKITAIGAHDDYVCWGDGDEIKCNQSYENWNIPKKMKLKGLTDIVMGRSYLCARSKTESYCWTRTSNDQEQMLALNANVTEAKTWIARSQSLCYLAQAGNVACIDPLTGADLDPTSYNNHIPAEFVIPNSEVVKYWANESYGCALKKNASVTCWSSWTTNSFTVPFSEKVQNVFGTTYSPCGLLDSGQVECRLDNIQLQTLPKPNRLRVEFGAYSKCFWNEGGLDCRGRSDRIEFRSVQSLSASLPGESICIIGVPVTETHGLDTIRCFSYDPNLKSPTFDLPNPRLIAVHGSRACAVSDLGLNCWGESFTGMAAPTTVIGVRKIRLADSHGCLIDDLGLSCWGELDSLNLKIPSGLEQPGRVLDFAVGSSSICAVLNSGEVQCWGRDFNSTGPAPVFTGATSIVGRGSLFCALGTTDTGTGLHCWGGINDLPR